jgi:hypothetical protein
MTSQPTSIRAGDMLENPVTGETVLPLLRRRAPAVRPALAQKAAFVTGAALGCLAGFGPTYEPAPELEPVYVS